MVDNTLLARACLAEVGVAKGYAVWKEETLNGLQ